MAGLDFFDVFLRDEARIPFEYGKVILQIFVVSKDHLLDLLDLDFVDIFHRLLIGSIVHKTVVLLIHQLLGRGWQIWKSLMRSEMRIVLRRDKR